MKPKERELLAILRAETRPLSGSELAERLGVSVRSVKNYVRGANGDRSERLIVSTRAGYSLNRRLDDDLLAHRKTSENVPQTVEERMTYVVKALVSSHDKALGLYDLCDELGLGYSTLRTLIGRMNAAFETFGVRFVTRDDDLLMEGSEADKRRLIMQVINEELNEAVIDPASLDEYFEYVDVIDLWAAMRSVFKTQGRYLNEFAAINLFVHLAIIVDRAKAGRRLTGEESGYAGISRGREPDEGLLDALCGAVQDRSGIRLDDVERSEIGLLIAANSNRAWLPTGGFEDQAGEEAVRLTDLYIDQIAEHFMLDLSSDVFRGSFATHIRSLLVRAGRGRSAYNPLADSVRTSSPFVFDIAVWMAQDLERRCGLSLDEGEIAFLAMHIGSEVERQSVNSSKVPAVLLCHDYLDLAESMVNRLMMRFSSQLDIRNVIHGQGDLDRLAANDSDVELLLSTMPVKTYPDLRVFELSPFPTRDQYDALQDLLDDLQEDRRVRELNERFDVFFSEELYLSCPTGSSREAILDRLCGLLAERGCVEEGFRCEVDVREQGATTAFGKIAIPHSNNMDAHKTCVAVATSTAGFDWGGQRVNVVLLMAISRLDRRVFRSLYGSLVDRFANDALVQRASACRTFEEFRALVFEL